MPNASSKPTRPRCGVPGWAARASVALVLLLNVSCALQFVIWPDRYAPSFELQGVAGRTMVRGLGVLFLMWNATYPPVLRDPEKHRALFTVVLVQQAIGLIGEIWIWATLPAGHAPLLATGLRFILFDGLGLLLMSIGYGLLFGCLGRVPRKG